MPGVLPGRAFRRTDRVSRLFFHWRAADLSLNPLTGQIPSFARTSGGTARDALLRGRTLVHSQPRFDYIDTDGDGILEPHLLLEAARTQLVTDPENFGAWTVSGTPILTSGQADPFGGTAAYLIEDNDAIADERVSQVVSFTGDGEKACAIFVKAGTSTQAEFLLHDDTLPGPRHWVRITWTAGVPTLSTSNGSGTRYPIEEWAGGWYRIAFSALGVVAANVNRLQISPTRVGTAADTGTMYIFGANAWNALFPSSYQGPNLGTRSTEDFTWTFPQKPQPMFIYVKFVNRGTWLDTVLNRGIVGIGESSANSCFIMTGSGRWSGVHRVGGVDVSQGTAAAPAVGDVEELLMILNANGSVSMRQSLNGGAEGVTGPSAANAFAAAWTILTLRLGGRGSTDTLKAFEPVAVCKVGPLVSGGQTIDTIAKARGVAF